MMINFYTAFLSGDAWRHNRQIDSLLRANGLSSSDSSARTLIAAFRKPIQSRLRRAQTVANHIDRAVSPRRY